MTNSSRHSRPTPEADRFHFWGLVALLFWVPLPWGSVQPWAVSLDCLGIYLLSALWLAGYAYGRIDATTSIIAARTVGIVWLVLIVYVFIQAEVPGAGRWSAPGFALYEGARNAGIPVTEVISISPRATLGAAFLSFAYIMLFCLVLLLVRTRERLRAMAYTIVISGVLQAVYGLFMSLSGMEYGFLAKKSISLGVATGTFVNRNHFAGYLEMTLALAVGLLLGGHRSHQALISWRDWSRAVGRFLLSIKAPLRIGILIMALALILSRSRMGNIAFLTSLTLTGLVFVMLAKGTFRIRAGILWISILLVDVSFLGSYFGLEELKQRIETTTATEIDNRVDISDRLQTYVTDFQPLGSGLGTFERAFLPYLTPEMQVIYEGAEDDYLQFLGELGVMAVLLCFVVAGSLWVALRSTRSEGPMLYKGMSFAAVMGITSLLIHSIVDFNLQIPSNAMLMVVLLALCWISAYQPFDPLHNPLRHAVRQRQK